MPSVLQDWVMELGLRHQGSLLTGIRGCDTAPKDDSSKMFVRCLRDIILVPFCGDSKKSVSFIEHVDDLELDLRFEAFRKNLDHYPHHYVMHLIHCIEIIGYKHPNNQTKYRWYTYYVILCKGLHLNFETEYELDKRLNAREEDFGK